MQWLLALIFCCAAISVHGSEKTSLGGLDSWQSAHYREHPLVGRTYSGDGQEVDFGNFVSFLSDVSYLLIGEIHDNPDHHRLQASLLRSYVKSRNTRPVVVFEMVPQRLQGVLDSARSEDVSKGGGLGEKLEWEERGWSSWQIYIPIFSTALENSLPLEAGSLDRTEVRAVSREGVDTLNAEEHVNYGLESDLPSHLQDGLAEELKTSHCGLLPESSIPAMIDVQRLRDGVMAHAMLGASNGHNAILIAGNGHVRKDRGVPLILRKREPDAGILSIGLIEVSPDAQTFDEYSLKNTQGETLYDVVMFTPKFSTTDHCAALQKQLSKKEQNEPAEQD